VEIKVSLPREDLMSLARLATSRNEATRDTASKIIREYVAAQQSMHLTAFGAGTRRGFAKLLIKLAYWLAPIGGR
jgi:hypothetical protein